MKDLISLSQLFDKRIYRIPDYQRGYAWTNSQLEDFWDDLNNLTENRYHYTGMLSLKLLDNAIWEKWEEERWIIRDKGYSAYHVVDGQQRLTTFIILVNSIIKCAINHKIEYINGDDIEDIKSRYIVEYKKPERLSKAFKFGYESDNPSFEFLRYSILGEGKSKSLIETFYTLNLEKARNYFDKCVETLYSEKGLDALEILFRKLVNRLQFNIHYIDDDFDVFVAFETMNNRGKKLSNLEILKNRLIYLTTIYQDKVLSIDEKNQLRKDINDVWKEVYYQLGRNKNKPLNDDEYLKNHWSLFFKYSRTTGDDYIRFLLDDYFTAKAVYGIKREIIKEIDDESKYEGDEIPRYEIDETDEILVPSKIKQYVDSLMTVAQYWYYSFNPEECKDFTNDEIKWILKLNRVGINYYRTLVIASFINKNVTSEQRIRLFKVIEKSLFVFFRMAKFQSSYQSTVAYNFARELMKYEKNIEEIIKSLENKFDDKKKEAIETFVTKIQGLFKNGNGYYSWSDLRYLLFEYEMELYDETHVPKLTDWDSFTRSEKDRISIEHIFPQTPSKFYWRNQFRDYSQEEQYHLANSLGNLLALSQSVNSSLQNDEFEDKKKSSGKRKRGYSNGSHSEVEVSQYPDWTPDAIKERGLKFLTFIEDRWDLVFDENLKLKALGLEFMSQEREVSPELDKDDLSQLNDVDENENSALREEVDLKIKDLLDEKEKQGLLYLVVCDKKHIRFVGKQMRKKAGLLGNGTWRKMYDFLVYEISNTLNDGVYLSIFIGPSDNNDERQRWHNFAVNTEILGGKYKTMRAKWDPMNKPFIFANSRNEYNSDVHYANTILDNIKRFLENEFVLIENAFENAPDDKTDPVYLNDFKAFDEKDIDGFLKSKNKEVVSIFINILNKVQENLAKTNIVAKPNYIALRNKKGNNICEFHFLKEKLQINTRIPKSEDLMIGLKLPDKYLWTLNYRIDVYKSSDLDKISKVIIESFKQIE